MTPPKRREYAYDIKTIDSHTMGEPTRIVYDGFPELPGETMMDKKNFLMEHYDYLRSALMLEPRGASGYVRGTSDSAGPRRSGLRRYFFGQRGLPEHVRAW